jgi:drug/metabolite transporter (DMT)-like permease
MPDRLLPVLFVLLWSTGWTTARFASDHADPLTFLALRHGLTALALAGLALALRAPWPDGWRERAHGLACGVLLNALYLGGVWWAIGQGVPAGISGLIAALQPIMTAMLAPWLIGETIRSRQWAGIGLGFCGIGLVLWPKLAAVSGPALGAALLPLAINAAAMLSATLGTFYQKRFLPTGHPLTTQTFQFAAACAVTLPLAWALEPMRLDPVWQTAAARPWPG